MDARSHSRLARQLTPPWSAGITALLLRDTDKQKEFRSNKAVTGPRTPRSHEKPEFNSNKGREQ